MNIKITRQDESRGRIVRVEVVGDNYDNSGEARALLDMVTADPESEPKPKMDQKQLDALLDLIVAAAQNHFIFALKAVRTLADLNLADAQKLVERANCFTYPYPLKEKEPPPSSFAPLERGPESYPFKEHLSLPLERGPESYPAKEQPSSEDYKDSYDFECKGACCSEEASQDSFGIEYEGLCRGEKSSRKPSEADPTLKSQGESPGSGGYYSSGR